MRPRSLLRLLLPVAAAVLTATPAVAGAAPAGPPPLPTSDPFYSWSGSLSGVAPGTVLRSRTVELTVNSTPTPVQATQLLYRTSGELGQPTVTVATVIRPVPLSPPAATRIVSWQMFYDALGSECDPSYTLRGGNPSYGDAGEEEALFSPYLASGDTIVVPDYEGEGLDWGAGHESGYDTLDAIRAAEAWMAVPPATTPVAMVGYSGGSIATEWAAELAPAYAPRLDLVGAAAGGVPVDYAHNLTYVNGSSSWSGVIPAVLVGVSRAYHLDLTSYLSAYGQKVTEQVSGGCINSFTGAYPGLTIQSLLKPQYQNFDAVPVFARIVDGLIMGSDGTPAEPQLLGVGDADGTGDGVMVAADVEALAHTYCQRGVNVAFYQYNGDSHTEAAVPFEAEAEAFVHQRLAGLPVVSNCSSVGTGNSLAPLPAGAGPGGGGTTAAPATTTATPATATAAVIPAAGTGPGGRPSTSLAQTGADTTRFAWFGAGLILDGLLLVAVVGRLPGRVSTRS
jgi:hypothetical protein